MPTNVQTFEQRIEHLRGERETCYGAMAIVIVLAPFIMLKTGFRGWLNALWLMRENLRVVKDEEARLRRYAESRKG